MSELVTTESQNILSGIMRAASDPNVDVAKLKSLLDMQKELVLHQAENDFNEAMNKVQQEIPQVVRQAENKHTKSKFAKLENVDNAIRPIWSKHGFSLSFGSKPFEGGVTITCRISRGGYSRIEELPGMLDTTGPEGKKNKTDIQGLGATVSYLRRYLTCMIFNVVLTNEDNDGQAQVKYITLIQKEALEKALGPFVDDFCKKYQLESLGELAAEDFDKTLQIAKNFAAKQ